MEYGIFFYLTVNKKITDSLQKKKQIWLSNIFS